MEVYLNPIKYCKTPTGHPKGHPCCKIADYDDTAFGAGTLTVHPWRAGPDCGKFIIKMEMPSLNLKFKSRSKQFVVCVINKFATVRTRSPGMYC